jgi:hypothetical protein
VHPLERSTVLTCKADRLLRVFRAAELLAWIGRAGRKVHRAMSQLTHGRLRGHAVGRTARKLATVLVKNKGWSQVATTSTATLRSHSDVRRVGKVVAHAGLVARGVIYLLIGWVALMLAVGRGGHNEADQRGALETLAGKPYGSTMLWALFVGFLAYAAWRLSEAIWGVAGEGDGAGPRIKSGFRGVVYAFFALTTLSVLHGSGSSQATTQQDASARVMQHTGGRWAVGIVGAVVVIVGLSLVVEGLRRKFLKTMGISQLGERARRTVVALGVIGTTARGLIFALAGALVIEAAKKFDPAKARGLDEALRTLRNQPYGAALLGAAAVGLIIFGLYGLCEARWRRV